MNSEFNTYNGLRECDFWSMSVLSLYLDKVKDGCWGSFYVLRKDKGKRKETFMVMKVKSESPVLRTQTSVLLYICTLLRWSNHY